MSANVEEHVDLKALTTLGIPAGARYLIHITSIELLRTAIEFAGAKRLPIFILGGGSNVVLGSNKLDCLVLKIELKGREVTNQTDTHVEVKVGAGENWNDLVTWSVEQNLSGIESLALIPGTVGAAPVQNIGAYGQELHETILSVEAYDRTTDEIVTIPNADCGFGYRDSMFKHEGKQRYVVTAINLRLTPAAKAALPTYSALQKELDTRDITDPTVANIRDAVVAVRQSKLPDPAKVPTAGSFFHNPVIDAEEFQRLEESHPDIPHWPTPDGRIKLSAAWMVEMCGFKGKVENGVGMYDKQALCLINPGNRPAGDVLDFRDTVEMAVQKTFGVQLTMEPELIRL